ncbi:MAG TPA: ABC transporter permease [Synergistaceae bacterium]|nr:ABC transporter permease [Synergistaceae bacterium]HPJ25041.1 ABC transporter permease [Synergistaceae bacterium]HPQ36673.1 ABC transporter permease [Synergistaceae bacterium]
MKRLWALLIKEFIQIKRDRITLAIMVMIPVGQLLVFGFAINTDVKHLDTILFDQSRTASSRELRDAFEATQYFDIIARAESFEEVDKAIQSGTCKVGIIFPPDFAEKLVQGEPAPVQVLVDASDSMSSASAINAATMLGMVESGKRFREKHGGKMLEAYDIRLRAWYNPDFISPYYMVPGVLGVVLTMTMILLTSVAIVRERERGTLEQLVVTPMRGWEFLLGKIIPYIAVGYVQLTLGLGIGYFVFHVPLRGSLGMLYLLTFLFILASLAMGVLISSVSRTQMQAMQLSFFALLPSILLSGFMFPREAMPRIFFELSRILPLTYFLEIARSILLKGSSPEFLLPEIHALAILSALFLGISLLRFRRTLG